MDLGPPSTTALDPAADLADLIDRNVKAVDQLHDRAESVVTVHQRTIEHVTALLGRPRALYVIAAGVIGWVALNLTMSALGRTPFDEPPFFWLQGFCSAAAFLTAIMVLVRQNRQAEIARRRAHLELQVNLLAEQKLTKIVGLLEDLRRDLPNVRDRHDPMAEAMKQTADPGSVMKALENSAVASGAAPHRS